MLYGTLRSLFTHWVDRLTSVSLSFRAGEGERKKERDVKWEREEINPHEIMKPGFDKVGPDFRFSFSLRFSPLFFRAEITTDELLTGSRREGERAAAMMGNAAVQILGA